jgi:Na+-translocating ferredoxin:NAD+ oxidoreductase RnfA subunit
LGFIKQAITVAILFLPPIALTVLLQKAVVVVAQALAALQQIAAVLAEAVGMSLLLLAERAFRGKEMRVKMGQLVVAADMQVVAVGLVQLEFKVYKGRQVETAALG